MLYIASFALICAFFGFAAIARQMWAHPTQGDLTNVSVAALGKLEGSISNLKRVIVISDHIEAPDGELRSAVESNFKKGIHYLFLVSKTAATKEVAGYYKIFETLAEIAIKRHDLKHRVRDLVAIRQLPYDWPDYPYVFYEIAETEATAGRTQYLAFRGNQQLEGIADAYSLVPPNFAHTIAQTVLSGAPEAPKVRMDQFSDGSNVTYLKAKKFS